MVVTVKYLVLRILEIIQRRTSIMSPGAGLGRMEKGKRGSQNGQKWFVSGRSVDRRIFFSLSLFFSVFFVLSFVFVDCGCLVGSFYVSPFGLLFRLKMLLMFVDAAPLNNSNRVNTCMEL